MTTTAQAEREYSMYEALTEAAINKFASERDPARRAELLDTMATEDEHQARLHTAAFGPEPVPGEPCRDMSEALASCAVLHRAVAATERALATGQPRVPATDPRIEEVGRELLDQLATEPDPAHRAELCTALHDVVAPIVGAHAAMTLTGLAELYEEIAG